MGLVTVSVELSDIDLSSHENYAYRYENNAYLFDLTTGLSLSSLTSMLPSGFNIQSFVEGGGRGLMIATQSVDEYGSSASIANQSLLRVFAIPYDATGVRLPPRPLYEESVGLLPSGWTLDLNEKIFYLGGDSFIHVWCTPSISPPRANNPPQCQQSAQVVNARGEKSGQPFRPEIRPPEFLFRLDETRCLAVTYERRYDYGQSTHVTAVITNHSLAVLSRILTITSRVKSFCSGIINNYFTIQLQGSDRFVMAANCASVKVQNASSGVKTGDRTVLMAFNSSGPIGAPILLAGYSPNHRDFLTPHMAALGQDSFVVVGQGSREFMSTSEGPFIAGQLFRATPSALRPASVPFRVSRPDLFVGAVAPSAAPAGPGRFSVFWSMLFSTVNGTRAGNASMQSRTYAEASAAELAGLVGSESSSDDGAIHPDGCPARSTVRPPAPTATVTATDSAAAITAATAAATNPARAPADTVTHKAAAAELGGGSLNLTGAAAAAAKGSAPGRTGWRLGGGSCLAGLAGLALLRLGLGW